MIALESFKKVSPSTVKSVARERRGVFNPRRGTECDIYDDRGNLIRTVQSVQAPVNQLDSAPDILIEADDEFIVPLAQLLSYFKEQFGALRSLVESVTVTPGMETAAIIKLRSGMSIAVSDWQEDGEVKMRKAYGEYVQSSDSEKVDGLITVAA